MSRSHPHCQVRCRASGWTNLHLQSDPASTPRGIVARHGDAYHLAVDAADRRTDMAFIATAVGVAMILVVGWVVDASPMSTGEGWQRRTAVLLAVALLWALALLRGLNPVVLTIGVAAGVSWLNYDRLTDARSGGPSLVIMLLAVWWTALVGTRRQTVLAVVLGLLTSLTYLLDGDLAIITGMALVTVLGAVAARSYAGQQRLLADLRQAQRLLADQAAAAERARIAKEVHDVAAHSLAITMLHLTGARMLAMRLHADRRVIEAVDRAEQAGRESLTELRAAVGLLRDPDPPVTRNGPPAGATTVVTGTAGDAIKRLVEQYADAGLAVTLQVNGDTGRLPPEVGRALYRAVQESLANVVQHAGQVATRVQIEVNDHCTLAVRNSPAGAPSADSGGGHGLYGIQERIEALGGTVTAGPDAQGWQVRAHIPLGRRGHE